ncbi:MAG TPA: type IV secretion system protein [Anaeromyxobacteraceae bacterium]|nr:type IV secretion system protein [Anaeromyxobacteraceae bacterium]
MKSTELDRYLEESRGLERDYLDELCRSKRMAWRVAAAAGVLVALALLALVALLPLKRVEAFVVRVDNATGSVDIVKSLQEGDASYGEVVDKYWVNQYLLNRESYDWQTLQTAYDTTVLLSSPEVQREYRALFDGPSARDKVFSDKKRVVVRVRSITPGTGAHTALARFTRREETAGGAPALEQNLLATVGFRYVGGAMREEDRLINPLGFQVTSFRVDPEVVGPLP